MIYEGFLKSLSEIERLTSRFPNEIKLYGCYKEKELAAGVLVYETEIVAHAQYIAANAKGKEFGALDLLFDYIINEEFCNKRYFDFGISTENNGHILNTNLIAQKEGFGARAAVQQFFEMEV